MNQTDPGQTWVIADKAQHAEQYKWNQLHHHAS